ncbi:hypothetical protein [Enterococcus timonensis]|uniref:hypothetical protein n=1 Tax=Enterococcus timonensis TaxID=1852364 RepID=UPI0013BE9CFF|nr:hypothetical protein [Enterococcus timonensis]
MYVIKIFHGYLTKEGKRTMDATQAKRYEQKENAEKFAFVIGGRVKEIEKTIAHA